MVNEEDGKSNQGNPSDRRARPALADFFVKWQCNNYLGQEMIDEEAKAIKEVAKATGKAIDAGKELGKFISKFIAGPLEQGMGIFEDKLKYMRWERQVSFMDKTSKILTNRGLTVPNRKVPMKIAIPLFQAATVEDDDDLQRIWANLLVNAADKDSGVEVTRMFVSILQDLSFFEVQILEKIYSIKEISEDAFWTRDLPEIALTVRPVEEVVDPKEDVVLALSNLCRLGLLESALLATGKTSMNAVSQTVLGRKLYEVCTANSK